MNAVRPPTFRPRTAGTPLCAVELKRSLRPRARRNHEPSRSLSKQQKSPLLRGFRGRERPCSAKPVSDPLLAGPHTREASHRTTRRWRQFLVEQPDRERAWHDEIAAMRGLTRTRVNISSSRPTRSFASTRPVPPAHRSADRREPSASRSSSRIADLAGSAPSGGCRQKGRVWSVVAMAQQSCVIARRRFTPGRCLVSERPASLREAASVPAGGR